ncbi:uncharacterized protein K452DRAFT_314108 [Aplosporella prunicola CBS 121167]|uniref:Uncharacterized protein n=1 Tax=Aplosporella prunicola CBS 121167 TaxID=1176127 RepID=A0A6A6AWC9_9PEZI|nr:uncharacterized protein K452DRAFT_314108 [Aplosporella prunicola CBS 121167]KAF2135285.1 hypothetical protein K452DRAFT_314108 [Aplosporella prunicola CBS 121167]
MNPREREARRTARASLATELETHKEFAIINQLVKQPNASAKTSTQQIQSLTTAALLKSPPVVGSQLTITGDCLLEVVMRTTPEQQPKLVSLVLELRKCTVRDPATGEQL